MIVSLILSALIGAGILLLGNLGETELRILATTGSIVGYSLVGLFFSWLYENKHLNPFSGAILVYLIFAFVSTITNIWDISFRLATTFNIIGLHLALGMIFYHYFKGKKLELFTGGALILIPLSFIFSLLGIWDLIEPDIYIKSLGIIFITGISLLHISLLWLTKDKQLAVIVSLFSTIAMISILAVLLIIWIISLDNFNLTEMYYRVIGTFAILDGVGTVVTLIVKKVTSLEHQRKK